MSGRCLETWHFQWTAVHNTISHTSKRSTGVILRTSFTRLSTTLAAIEGMGTRLLELLVSSWSGNEARASTSEWTEVLDNLLTSNSGLHCHGNMILICKLRPWYDAKPCTLYTKESLVVSRDETPLPTVHQRSFRYGILHTISWKHLAAIFRQSQTHHLSGNVSIVLESEISSYESDADRQRETRDSTHNTFFSNRVKEKSERRNIKVWHQCAKTNHTPGRERETTDSCEYSHFSS